MFRTAALYVVGAWGALQAAALSFPGFGIPDAAIRAAIWAAVLGFPVAVVFGWLFEVSPSGIRRTPPVDADAAAEPRPLTRRDYGLLAAIALIALAVLYQAVTNVRGTPVTHASVESSSASETIEKLPNSIAVLPFANISNDTDNEYFCDGISEEILNALSGVRELNVIGRTSSFAFKGRDLGVDRISAALGVRYVLQGSVRKAGPQLRISAQLLDERGRQLWTETFDRELANVFDIQEEVAAAVATTVAAQMVSRPAALGHPNLEAYDHFLAGRERLHRRIAEAALQELGRAIELDPAFAEAHAEWAVARLIGDPGVQDRDKARAAIERALQLKPNLLRAQAARGLLLLSSDPPDAPGAEAILRSVLDQDPNMSDALLWLSNALAQQKRPDDARRVLERAVRVDPLHPSIVQNLAAVMLDRGETDQALLLLHRLIERSDLVFITYFGVSEIYRQTGRLVELHSMGRSLARRRTGLYYPLAVGYAMVGNWQTADDWLRRDLRDFPGRPYQVFVTALVPAWRGQPEEAARMFKAVLTQREIDIGQQPPFVQRTYGAILARAGQYREAIEVLEPLVGAEPSLLLSRPTPQLDGAHALAWSYLHTGARAKGEALLAKLWALCQVELASVPSPDSDLLHYCAETALLKGDREPALDLFERAVAAGWREYYLREHDPYWASVQNDARYRALMARVKADVDREAAEIARADATEDLAAKVDAARHGTHDPT